MISHGLRCQSRLLSHRNIAGSSGCHNDISSLFTLFRKCNSDSRQRMIVDRNCFFQQFRRLFTDTCDQNIFHAPVSHGSDDPHDLLRRFPGAVNHFRSPLPDTSVIINFRVIQILKRCFLKLQKRIFRGNSAVRHIPEKSQCIMLVVHLFPPV